jgi:hypothetical protein
VAIVIAETIHVDIPFIFQIVTCIDAYSGSEEAAKARDLECLSERGEALAVGAE